MNYFISNKNTLSYANTDKTRRHITVIVCSPQVQGGTSDFSSVVVVCFTVVVSVKGFSLFVGRCHTQELLSKKCINPKSRSLAG